MKEYLFPDPRKHRVFSPKRSVALLAITVALSFVLLFASADQIYAATSATAIATPTAIASSPLTVNLFLLGNAISIPVNTHDTLSAQVITSGPNETVTRVEFYSSTGGSAPTLIGTAQAVSVDGTYEVPWSPSTPVMYSLTAKAYDTLGNVATSNTIIANVVTPTPPPPLTVAVASPANGSVYSFPAQIPFSASIGGVVGSNNIMFVVEYTATLEPNGPSYDVGTMTQNTPSRTFTVTWIPPQAGIYSLVITANFIDEAGSQFGTSAPATVYINAAPCRVNYQLESQWSGGLNVNIVLTNTSSVPINGWTLAFTFPGDQRITAIWNGSASQTGKQVTIVNLGYDGSIPPGGTVSIGFNGTWVSNETSPRFFTLNGVNCSTM